MYMVTKNYTPVNGLSAVFRQWRAKSHCRFWHGYSLGFEAKLAVTHDAWLDENGWVFDFGGLKEFKAWLVDTFDHKTVAAQDDPALPLFKDMAENKSLGGQLIDLVILPRVGCEAFSLLAWQKLRDIVKASDRGALVDVYSMRCYEHEGNSATYINPYMKVPAHA